MLLTSGDKGSHDPDMRPGHLAARREDEQRAAAALLGVREVVFLRRPDGLLENTLDLRRELAASSANASRISSSPSIPGDMYQLHPDHRVAGQSALDAIFAAREWHVFPEQLAAGTEPVARQGGLPLLDRQRRLLGGRAPTTSTLASQLWPSMPARSSSNMEKLANRVRKLARDAGQVAGCPYAEAFKRLAF